MVALIVVVGVRVVVAVEVVVVVVVAVEVVGVSACGSLVYEMTIAAIVHNLGPKALLIT